MLVFDGSYDRDSTVLVGATVDPMPHLFLIRAGSGRWTSQDAASAGPPSNYCPVTENQVVAEGPTKTMGAMQGLGRVT